MNIEQALALVEGADETAYFGDLHRAAEVLAAAIRAQQARTCETCRHRDGHNECRLLDKGGYDDAHMQFRTEHHDCYELKFCGLWEPKEAR